MSFTVHEILQGTSLGATQSAGQLAMIPLLGEDDHAFAPPVVEVGTTGYGSVSLRNEGDHPTIVPPGAGWVVTQKAQDHAIGGGALLRPGETRQIDTAMCIQQSQGGLIGRARHALLILPAKLRAAALAGRHVQDFRKLWGAIEGLNKGFGISQVGGHLEFFLRTFQKELDEFVAELEVVPGQLGAVFLVGGEIAGIERTPSAAYFRAVWEPLVRVSYGSLALARARESSAPPPTRVPLAVATPTLAGLRDALARADGEEQARTRGALGLIRGEALAAAAEADDRLGPISLTTVASARLAGQVVTAHDAVKYASLCLAA